LPGVKRLGLAQRVSGGCLLLGPPLEPGQRDQGALAHTGGAGGATGAGGACSVTGGAGGATSGTGGAITIVGGAGTNGNANGGAVSIDGGAKNGSGADGLIGLGLTSGSFVKYGVKQQASAAANAITDPGNAGAIPVTADGVCNLTSAGAETRTLAIPTFQGQRLNLCMNVDGGDIVITVASAFNQATNTTITMNDAGDSVELVGVLIASALRWRLVYNDGCTLG
jgi:hypothetical protein